MKGLCGYCGGIAILAAILIAKGDAMSGLVRLVMLWLPIAASYAGIVLLVLKRVGLAQMPGMLELCGACIGAMPLFCGLWPTYWMRWDLALLMTEWQCAILTIVIVARVFWRAVAIRWR